MAMKKIVEVFCLKSVWVAAILIAGGSFVFLLVWTAETYNIPLAISLLAVTVATVATIATLLSLQWTRDTIRPFLYMTAGGTITPYEVMERYTVFPFNISNSGSLPATRVNVDIDFFSHKEEVTEDNNSSIFKIATKGTETPMILPNDNYISEYVLDMHDTNDHKLLDCIKQGKAKVRFRISYESLDRKHFTIQTFEISKSPWEKKPSFVPIPPQKWG